MYRSGSVAPFDETDDSDIDDIVKRNLMPLLDEQSLKPQKEYVKVFLRIRPFTKNEKERDENKGCIEVENESSVIVQAPKDSHTHRSTMYGLAKQVQKFTFTKVFGENTSQKTFFDETMLSTVNEFINGENCLVFSYGVTNSGKTYTIQGDPRDGGLLPRSLDVVFNSISGRIYGRMDLKPNMYCDVLRLSSEQEQSEIALKESIMRMTFEDRDGSCVVGSVSNSLPVMSEDSVNHPERDSVLDEISAVIANRKREEATIDVRSQGHIRFSIWISFVEIYNEQIFDLLVPVPKNKYERHPTLNLREDKQGNPYVKDLRQICVSSADEAYHLLALGKRNQRIACTKLNQSSSRSHCIFSIKMIRVVDREQPHYARISMLSLCDLAGSERHQKTDNTGDRLKEAGSINVSLMTLGRCINALRNNQTNKSTDRQQVVPFRDSKLTRIFHAYLTGKGRASMIVNISQCASIFDETLTCLRYSAIAKQVVVRESFLVTKPSVLEVRSSHVPPLNPTTALSRATVGWATPGTYLKMIEAGEISVSTDRFSTTKESDGSENDETINEENGGGEEDEEGHRTMTESSSCHADDSCVEAQRAEWSKDRAILLEVIKQLKEKLQAEINAKDVLELKIRAEVCEEMKAQLVIIENNYQESLRLREEINEEKLERKLEILTEAMQKSKKRRLEDDDEECVPKHLLNAEISKVQKQCGRIEELEDELNSLRQELGHVKSSFSQVAKERESFAQETTKAKFFASDAKLKLDDMKTKLDESSFIASDLNERIQSLTEECRSHELSVSKLTCTNNDLEAQNKLLEKGIEDRETKISSLEAELEECRKHQMSVDELKAKMNSQAYLEVSAERDKKIEELEGEKEALQKTSGEKDAVIRELETQIADLKKELTSSRHELLLTVHKLNSARDEITRITDSNKDSTQLLDLKAEVAELREKLSISRSEVLSLEEKLVAVNLEYDSCKKDVQKTSEGHLELKRKILELEAELLSCQNLLSSRQAEFLLVSGERDELLLEKQRLVNIISERGDQLVSLMNELSGCQSKLEQTEELFRKEKSELLQDREILAEQLRIKKMESVSDSTSEDQNMRPFSELEEKSQLIGELQTKLKDLSSEYELEKATAGKSAEDVVQLKLEVASLVEQLSRQKRAESGYLETVRKENQLLQQKLTASEELSSAMERQLQSSKAEAAELKMQLESKAETNTRLSRFSARKKSCATGGFQKPTQLTSNDADDEADLSRLEFENIINRNLQEVTNSSLTRYDLRSAFSRSTGQKCRENVDPMDSEQDETVDTPRQHSSRKTPSAIKKQSTGHRSSIFKSPPKSPSVGKRRRKLLNLEEQLTATPIQEETREMVAAPSPHTSVIRKLRSRRP